MSLLSDFEDRVSAAVEGVFAGVFRSPVQPAELARALAKQMERQKVVGVGKVYAPTLYTVLISEADDERLGAFASTLAGELSTYLIGVAQEQGYELPVKPYVRFLVDEDLKLGRFDAFAELVDAEEMAHYVEMDRPRTAAAGEAEPAAARPAPVRVPAAAAAEHPAAGLAEVGPAPLVEQKTTVMPMPGAMATVTVPGVQHDVVLTGDRMTVGRLKDCDICVSDANASRMHAAFVREGAGWAIEDLGSTNGTLLNGRPTTHDRLRDGDVVTVGTTKLVFHDPRG